MPAVLKHLCFEPNFILAWPEGLHLSAHVLEAGGDVLACATPPGPDFNTSVDDGCGYVLHTMGKLLHLLHRCSDLWIDLGARPHVFLLVVVGFHCSGLDLLSSPIHSSVV